MIRTFVVLDFVFGKIVPIVSDAANLREDQVHEDVTEEDRIGSGPMLRC